MLSPGTIRGVSCAAIFIAASSLCAQDEGRIQPRELDAPPATPTVQEMESAIAQDETVLVDSLQSLVFLKQEADVSQEAVEAEGLDTSAVALLDDEMFRKRVRPYLGQPVSLSLLYQIARETILYYRDRDRPVVDVFAPEQDISNGVVQMVVIESKLGEVRVEGNRWFSTENIRCPFRSKHNEDLRISQINRDLRRLNENPFRTVDLVFAAGSEDGTTDIILQTADRFPVRFYAGWEDTGSDLTGDERWLFGFNWGDAFFQGHQLNYQFTGSSDFRMLTAHSGSYSIPLPWYHDISFYGSHATSDVSLPGGTGIDGSSWLLGTRYTIPLSEIKNFRHRLSFGYEFKQSDALTDVAGIFQLGSLNDVSQFFLEYGASLPDRFGASSLTLRGVLSPGGMTGLNNDSDFQTSRNTSDTRSDYAYFKMRAERSVKLPFEFSSVHSITVQVANANLLPSEQLSAGGYYSVRGYDERELSDTDEGWLMRHELRTPAISLFDRFGIGRLDDELQFLAFWDYADVSPYQPLPGQSASESLSSVGAGLRYRLSSYLSVRADYGFQLTDVPGNNSRHNSRWHLGVLLSY